MPGRRTPADPLETNSNVHDTQPDIAGVQSRVQGTTGGGQYATGEAPPDGAYKESAHLDQGPNDRDRA